jgi:hypothetical protein
MTQMIAQRMVRRPSEMDAPPHHVRPSVLDHNALDRRNGELLAALAREVETLPTKPEPVGISFPIRAPRPKHDKKTIDDVIDACLTVCYVDAVGLLSSKRHPALVLCRRLIVVAARLHTTASYPEISAATRGRSEAHVTSIDAYQRFMRDVEECVTIWGLCRTHREWLELVEKELGIKPKGESK